MTTLQHTCGEASLTLRVSVIIVTLNRPDCVQRCLDCLRAQDPLPHQIIVVDASANDHTRLICEQYAGLIYLRNERGFGHMTQSRNIGLQEATGDVLAFIDDDAFAHEGWLANIAQPYEDRAVGAVGGRVIQGTRAPEPWVEISKIGKLMPDGELYAGFDTDSGRILEVDHMMGCNMSFRRSVVAQLGGFRDDFPGTEVCEESDMSLRVRRLGSKILYNPTAVVTHVGAPQFKGRRFDARYNYYAGHNNAVLLIRNYGVVSLLLVRFVLSTCIDRTSEMVRSGFGGPRSCAGGVYRFAAYFLGLGLGILVGIARRLRQGASPLRRDAMGSQIRHRLAEVGPAAPSLQTSRSV